MARISSLGNRAGRLGLVLGLVFLARSAAAQPSGLADFLDRRLLDRFNLNLRWYARVPAANLRETINDLKVIDGMVFATSSRGLIHCLDAETGQLRWTATIGDDKRHVFPPAVTTEFVYVTSGTNLVQLDRGTGHEMWVKELSGVATSAPAANEDFVYVQTGDDRISAYSLKLGEENKNLAWPEKRVFERRPLAWYYSAGGPMVDPPIVLPELVAFATRDGVVYASALKERKILYRFLTYSRQAAPLAHLDRFLYIATEEFDIYAIDLLNGFLRWRHVVGYPVYTKPLPFADDLFVVAQGAGLVCIANQDNADKGLAAGDLRWRARHVTRIVGVSEQNLYSADGHDNFQIRARSDGHLLATFPARAFTVPSENQFTDRIYMSTADGLVVCLHEKGKDEPFLHPQTIAEATEEKEKAKDDEKETKKPSFFDEEN